MKKIAVFGLGKSGESSAKFLAAKGYEVYASDDNLNSMEILKKQNIANVVVCSIDEFPWQKIDELVLSPGIPLYSPKPHRVVDLAKENNCEIICDIEILYRNNPNAKYIGVTGTNGKSTTTALIGHIFKELGCNVQVGGNIGMPVLSLDAEDKDTIYILEMSSYQLDLIDKLRFNVAIFLNLTPDHIDRHGNFERYKQAKLNIFKNQQEEDYAVLSVDGQVMAEVFDEVDSKAKKIPISNRKRINDGIYLKGWKLEVLTKKHELLKNNYLPGIHNSQNIAAAIATAFAFNLDIEKVISAIAKFKGLAHRMQLLGKIAGIWFVNDSKATNAESSASALQSFENIFWILGGIAKEEGIKPLAPFFNKIKKAYLIGQSKDEFAEFLDRLHVKFNISNELDRAFYQAFKDAKKSGLESPVILFSPACASFDQWKNFEERGETFCELYKEIAK